MNDLLDKLADAGLFLNGERAQVEPLLAEGMPLDEALVSSGAVPESRALQFLAREFGYEYTDLSDYAPSPGFLKEFPVRILVRHRLLPLREDENGVAVATSRISDTSGLDELRVLTDKALHVSLAPSDEIDRCLQRFLGVGADTMESMTADEVEGVQVLSEPSEDDVDLASAEDASIIRFVNQILAEGIRRRATDVHFEPFEHDLRVRYRVDGVLQEANIPPQVKRFQAAIISRLKIMSQLDIAEKRRPQDGRVKLRFAGHEIDVRVSVIPTLHGEGMALRLLDRDASLIGLTELGMSEKDKSSIERVLALPHGIFLVTGPTGSGKTTTLYASLAKINDTARKIITIEDPIEYHLHGINQMQVNTKSGLTFANGLRSILRHDPDVVLVGEIRDTETAEIAVQASLTGHLVFSTLHTNDAPGAVTRLVEMNIEPYLVASSLEGVLAQRLVRLICKSCRKSYEPISREELSRELGTEVPQTLYRGLGCRECQFTGYRGRSGIFELMTMTEEIKELALRRASAGEIRQMALSQGMNGLRTDGVRLVEEGRTTVDEVLRVTHIERANGNGLRAESAHDLHPGGGKEAGN